MACSRELLDVATLALIGPVALVPTPGNDWLRCTSTNVASERQVRYTTKGESQIKEAHPRQGSVSFGLLASSSRDVFPCHPSSLLP